DLWRVLAGQANAAAARLADGLRAMDGVAFAFETQANMLFVRLPRAMHQRLHAAGAVYALWEGPLDGGDPDEALLCRLVCDWSCDAAKIDRFLSAAAG
ncbi:MAG: low specificity L-threonine aldolase, partial [Pseudomonadota bacterium]